MTRVLAEAAKSINTAAESRRYYEKVLYNIWNDRLAICFNARRTYCQSQYDIPHTPQSSLVKKLQLRTNGFK